jgi:hypothetical protein
MSASPDAAPSPATRSMTRFLRRVARVPLQLARVPVPTAVIIFVAVATQLVANELDRLVAEVLSSDGHVHALTDVLGWGAGTQLGNWTAWSTAAVSPVPFIFGNTIADVVFVACYAVLGSRLIRVGFAHWRSGHPDDVDATPTVPADLLLLLVVADLAEDAVIFILGGALLADPSHTPISFGALPVVLACFTYLKLVSLVLLGGYVVMSDRVGALVRSRTPRVLRAIYAQRLVVLVVLAVGLMSLLSLPDLFEQVSDLYRSLFTFTTATPPGVPTVDVRIVSVIAADILTGLVIYAVSRERVRHYATRATEDDDREPASLRGWFIAAAAISIPGALFAGFSHWHLVDAFPFFTLVGAVLFVAVSSLILRVLHVPMLAKFGRVVLAPHAHAVETAGNILVALWVAICFFAPFKAMLSPLFLAATNAFGPSSPYRYSFVVLLCIEIVALAGGVLGAGYVWRRVQRSAAADPVAGRGGGRIRQAAGRVRLGAVRLARSVSSRDPGASDDPKLAAFNWWMFAISAAILLLALVFPALAGVALGPLGAFILLLGAWAAILGTLIRALGAKKPLEIFALVRLRATPIVTLLITVPLVVSLIDSVPGLHAIRFDAEQSVASTSSSNPDTTRPPLDVALDGWLKTTDRDRCAAPLVAADGSIVNVRPLVLIAAQGGGIRAATWTVDVVDQLPANGKCADDSALISSGASGGSIGLATFHDQNASLATQARNSTTRFAGQDALGAVIVSLIDGDLLGGMTGIRVPSATSPTDLAGAWDWHDRTALQELTWQREIPAFNQPFTAIPARPTGYLVFNSTDSVTDCKVLVSQIDLGTTSTAAAPDCNGSSVNLSNTIDLRDTLGSCFWNLEFSTAAELSARFPVISPPGRIDETTVPSNCTKGLAAMQLVDGGTTDNSAVGTLTDIAPTLAGLVAKANATRDGSTAKPFIVPVVVYSSNYPGLDLTANANRTKPDALVPISILGDAQAAEVAPAAWLTRASSGYSQVCSGFSARNADASTDACRNAVSALRKALPRGIVVVSPSTSPAVSVPLGWTLSGFSEAQLKYQAGQQAECLPTDASADGATCRVYEGYGTYGALLRILSSEHN